MHNLITILKNERFYGIIESPSAEMNIGKNKRTDIYGILLVGTYVLVLIRKDSTQ